MPNDPYLDASVRWRIRSGHVAFEEPRYADVVQTMLDVGIATEVLALIGSGKEADVYVGHDGPVPVAIKAYRMYRSSHRGGRPIKVDTMGQLAVHEFDMLVHAYRGGARVPEPGRRVENFLSMEFLGTPDGPAPRLREATPRDPAGFLDELLRATRRLAQAGVVHSDLSPFNVLVHRGLPWFIDLGECYRVDRLGEAPWRRLTEAEAALTRGLGTFDRHFRRYGLRVDVEGETRAIVEELDRFGVLD
jgi:serine/threonine-protein kinase RIO1